MLNLFNLLNMCIGPHTDLITHPHTNFTSFITLQLYANYLNEMPRGLGALLGHLLVNRIPVMYKISSPKITEY